MIGMGESTSLPQTVHKELVAPTGFKQVVFERQEAWRVARFNYVTER